MTSFTPSSLRAFNDRRKLVQNPSFFRVSRVEAEDFPAPVGSDTDGDDDRLGHDPVVNRGFAVCRVEDRYG